MKFLMKKLKKFTYHDENFIDNVMNILLAMNRC